MVMVRIRRRREANIMGKTANPRALKDNEAKAVCRMLRVSPQKLNLLAQLIRGKAVDRALNDIRECNCKR
jgi:large subunit ribosomal protein L22